MSVLRFLWQRVLAFDRIGKVIEDFTADQRKYYGFDESAFPSPSSEGRVLLLLSMP